MKICFATHNENKLQEAKTLLHPIEVIGLNEIGLSEEIPETGSTLDENAIIKANYIHSKYGFDCFADDTGLEVESLNGAPGVYSARYAGEPRNNEANIELLLENLKDFSNRKARFRTSICLIIDSTRIMFDGVVNGDIIGSKIGIQGFGYDPIFLPDGYDKTFAEMSMDEKNLISHRGRAIKKLTQYLHALK